MARLIRKVNTRPSPKPSTTRIRPKRTIPSTGKSQSPKSAPRKTGAGFDRGSAGFAKARDKREKQEQDYQRRKDTPFAFWLKPGTEAEVIVLDDQEPFFVSMHKVKNARGKWEDEVCIADTGQACPLCESTGKEGSYTMVLTILDRRPYRVQSGPNAGKTVKVSKKLMYVKGRNLPKFQRQYEGKARGNFKGLKILCRRDGDKESAMGEDIEFLGRVSADFLSKFGENSKPVDYTKIFAMPSAEELEKRYGKAGGGDRGQKAGSEEFEDDDGFDGDDVGWGKKKK